MSNSVRKHQVLLFLFLLITVCSFAQDRSNYALLWEIEHKDSDKKSYLFGTMHLKDKRVFNFSDALLPSIKKSDVFALEINPESIASKFIESLSKKDFLDKYKEILNADDYDLLQEKIKKSTGKQLNALAQNNPDYIETILRPDLDKDDDKDIFLDLYLYQIAASLEKEILGLEEVKDQMINYDEASDKEIKETIKGLINYKEEEYVSKIEELIDIYVSGDISKILAYTSESNSYDAIMERRNKKMIQSMQDIMKSKTVFAAIGAAHLPGEIGVIHLLREEGYTVRKVENVFTGKSNKYTFTPNLDQWEAIKDSIHGYTVRQPSSAQKLDLVSFTGFNGENAFIDFKSGANFFHFAFDIRSRDADFQEHVTDNFIANIKARDSSLVISTTKVKRNEHQFSQVMTKSTGKRIAHFEVFSKHGVFYVFGVEYSPSIAKATAESFFNSIQINTPKFKETTWASYTDAKGAYTIKTPGELTDMSRETPNPEDPEGDPYVMNMYTVQDIKNKQNYLIRYNNFPIGYYLQDISEISDGIVDQLKKTGSTLLSEKKSEYKGYIAYDYEIMLQGKYHAAVRYISRGNRTYVLLAQSLSQNGKTQFDNPFFNSLAFETYTPSTFETIQNVDHNLSFLFPKKQFNKKDLEIIYDSYFDDAVDYYGLNEGTGGSYSVYISNVKKYFRLNKEGIEPFFDEYAENYKEYGDTIYKSEKSQFGKYPTKTYFISSKKTPILKKYKFLLIEDQFVVLGGYLGQEEIDSAESEAFYNGIQIDDLDSFDNYSSKAKFILEDLKSKDSLVRLNANGALNYYEFDASEKVILEKGLTKEYHQDTAYYGTKNMIIYNLGIVGDNKTVSKLESYYNTSKSTNRNKLMMLSALPKIKTDIAIDTYFELLQTAPPLRTKKDPYPVLEPVSDSIFNYKTYGDEIFKLNDNTLFRDQVISYWERTINQDSTAIDYLKNKKEQLFQYFEKDVNLFIDSYPEEKPLYLSYEGIISDYISLLSSLKITTNEHKGTIEKLLQNADKMNWYTYKLYEYYITYTDTISEPIVSSLLEDSYYRFEVMQFLLNQNKQEFIPKEYFEFSSFGELSVYNAIGDHYHGYSGQIDFKETMTYKEGTYNVYTISFTSEEDGIETYVGVVKKEAIDFENFALLESHCSYKTITDDSLKNQAITILKSLE